MHVDTHWWGDRVRRFAPKASHEGWFFKIEGKYKHEAAKSALDDAQKHPESPKFVGLEVATKPWKDAEKKCWCGS